VPWVYPTNSVFPDFDAMSAIRPARSYRWLALVTARLPMIYLWLISLAGYDRLAVPWWRRRMREAASEAGLRGCDVRSDRQGADNPLR
jgi:hypothetical protein